MQELQVDIADWHQIKRIRPTTHTRRTAVPDLSVDKVRYAVGTTMLQVAHRDSKNNLIGTLRLVTDLYTEQINLMQFQAVHKVSKVSKAKGQNSGRTYTSKYRGVHQTFPTKRWEAQFRCACRQNRINAVHTSPNVQICGS